MGGQRPRLQTARDMQRQLHCDLGAVSTCANDVLHIVPLTAKERAHDASAEDFARVTAQVREPKPPLEPGVGAGVEVAIRQALKLRPITLLAQAISCRDRARMVVCETPAGEYCHQSLAETGGPSEGEKYLGIAPSLGLPPGWMLQ